MEITNAKNRFAECMREIMHKKPIKQVTVSELTEQVGLSRQTFYQLFTDKYDLVAYIWALEVQKIKMQSKPNETLSEFWIRFLHTMQSDPGFFKNLLEHMDEQNAFFYSWIDISEKTPVVSKSLLQSSPDLMLASRLFTYGSAMCVRDWVLGGCKKAPEDLTRQLILSIPGVLMPYIVLGETEQWDK